MRQTSGSDLQTLVEIDKGKGKITIEAVDAKGNFMNFLEPTARLVQPDMKSLDVPLDQTGPGRYEASFEARQLGTYLANIQTKQGGKTTSQITGAVLPYSPEYNAIGTNEFLLNQISETAEGDRFALTDASKIFSRPRRTARAPRDIWLPLLMLAALLFPLDVAVRRLMWGESEIRHLRSRLRAPKLPRKKDGAAAQPRDEKLGALLKAKQRAGQERHETGDTRQEKTAPSASPIPGAAPDPGGAPAPRQSPPPRSSAPEPAPATSAEPEEEDALTRLRRAKERARRDS